MLRGLYKTKHNVKEQIWNKHQNPWCWRACCCHSIGSCLGSERYAFACRRMWIPGIGQTMGSLRRQKRQVLMSLEMGNLWQFPKGNEVAGIQSSIHVPAKTCMVLEASVPRVTIQPVDCALGLIWNPKTPRSTSRPGTDLMLRTDRAREWYLPPFLSLPPAPMAALTLSPPCTVPTLHVIPSLYLKGVWPPLNMDSGHLSNWHSVPKSTGSPPIHQAQCSPMQP